MLATEFAKVYVASRLRVSHWYVDSIRRIVRRMNEHAGRPLRMADWSEPAICSYLANRAATVGPVTVNNERRIILTLAAAAADEGLLHPLRNRKVRRLPEPQPDPQAWTVEEITLLLRWVRRHVRGVIGDVPAALWWCSMLGIEFATGARIGAVLMLPAEAFDGRGLSIRERKTGKLRYHALPPWLCECLSKFPPNRERLLPWPFHRSTFFHRLRRIVDSAGIPCPRSGRQLTYRLRRSHISYCAAVSMDLAQQQGGHSSQRVTARYVDPRIAAGLSALAALPTIHIEIA